MKSTKALDWDSRVVGASGFSSSTGYKSTRVDDDQIVGERRGRR